MADLEDPKVAALMAQISQLSARCEAETNRADNEAAQKNEAMKRADDKAAQKNEAMKRADDEAAQKHEAMKRADDEAAQKHEAIKQTERVVKRARGEYWLTISSLSFDLQKKTSPTAYEKAVTSDTEAGRKSIFRKFLPSLNWLQTFGGTALAREDVHRSAPDFLHGIWNQSCKDGAAQRAHLVPFSFDCCMDWKCLFIPFVVLLTTEVTEPGHLNELCLCMMLGLTLARKKFHFSGFLHSFLNFIPLCGQQQSLDNDPSIMFIPMLSIQEILFWNGGPYNCLIIGSNLSDMMTSGFLYVMPENGEEFVDTESFCELPANHPQVLAAFENFRALLLMVVPFLAVQALTSVTTLKAALCRIFRFFLAKQKYLMCPFIDEESRKCVMCLKFAKRVLSGMQSSPISEKVREQKAIQAHQMKEPALAVTARSVLTRSCCF